MYSPFNIKKEFVKIAGRIGEMVTVFDEKGNIVQKLINPLMIEFRPRDVMQVMVGAALLAIPVAFTEETWRLGETLPVENIGGIAALSFLFISSFVYYNYYRGALREHWFDFAKRVFSTYLFSMLIVAVILTLIERASWTMEPALALKRVILVSFPASMSAAIADTIK